MARTSKKLDLQLPLFESSTHANAANLEHEKSAPQRSLLASPSPAALSNICGR